MSSSVNILYGTVSLPVVVIGGGPTLLEDLKKIPGECFKIAVNHHCNGILEPDLAFTSHADHIPNMDYECEIVGPRGADYLYNLPKLQGCYSMSGYKAAMIALMMTDKEVYIVGIDCYSGDKDYLDREGKHGGYEEDLCMKGWVEIDKLHPGRLVFFSDILINACK